MERYGGSTTEIVDIELREDESETRKIVSQSLADQLHQNEKLQEGESGSFTPFCLQSLTVSNMIRRD